jgi:rhodanese-related sulfurtransferase
MNRILLCIFLSFASFYSFGQTDTTLLSPEKLEKVLAAGNVQLVDVRTPEEFKKGHIPNSILVDWKNKKEFESKAKSLDPAKPVYLYCAAGARSHAAAEYLREQGFKQVYELDGGFNKWKEAKKPLQE